MARIQIPLDALTSRLNLGSRFESVRSQSISTRFANLKPVSEFLDLKRLSKPANFGEVQSRVNYNLGYFSSNYAAVAVMLAIYSLLTNLTLLFDIIFLGVGLFGIKKLEGRDLELGFTRATTSQLYTGFFFRGGGLGGRPRTPYDTPLWGRPSGARHAKRRKDRDVHARQREEDLRFEELNSESDGGQGVNRDGSFASDELQFTGADLGAHLQSRQRKGFQYDSETSEEEDLVVSEQLGGMMQLALRDKEELLVQKALERIRRAQALGKTNVKLSQPELDALERKRRKDQSTRKTSGTHSRLSDRRRSSLTASPASRQHRPGNPNRKSSSPRNDRGDAPSTDNAAAPPGLLLRAHDGPSYAPLGYYPSASPLTQGSRLQSTSLSSPRQQHITSDSPQHIKVRDKHKRNSSGVAPAQRSLPLEVSDPLRRLPDDPGWSPRPRSASSNHPYAMDPFQYQQYSPSLPQMPQHYTQNRRIVSGPPNVPYPDVQYLGARRAAFATQQSPAASSEPSLFYREHSGSRQAEAPHSDEESGDSEDYGVQVDMVPYGRGYGVRVEPESPVTRLRRDQR